MIGPCHKHEIAYRVIRPITVYVMYAFVSEQTPPDMLLHSHDMDSSSLMFTSGEFDIS
ncbi:hypothetical protein PROAA_1010001 [Candidatus Propionivibrio aalborgensis]|uniref:Uncharacterized protein n=1 Tax=Candidatus Propionivibrio aalborgensis TaxID=1860101 RepID=A0A1A8XH42_9RHOO|nr:hypothetical protein PROAA_1010001 [Candidatus Propionivibrio aalborgensis]